jgi:hypothetical protein
MYMLIVCLLYVLFRNLKSIIFIFIARDRRNSNALV